MKIAVKTKMHRKNTHVVTAERRLAEWFIKCTARDTCRHTTVLEAVYARHSNFWDFWVALVQCFRKVGGGGGGGGGGGVGGGVVVGVVVVVVLLFPFTGTKG
jgi:uncharacterized membrane protein